jgi:hypothetical protein
LPKTAVDSKSTKLLAKPERIHGQEDGARPLSRDYVTRTIWSLPRRSKR